MQGILPSLARSISSIRASDVVDIAIVAVLLYSVLWLLRTTVSRTLLGMVVALTALYFIARSFDLFLTEIILRAGAVIAFVGFGITFQDDLRRALVRLWSRRLWRRPTAIQDGQLDTLAEVAFNFAAERTGALIVLRGKESLIPYLQGGISLSAPVNAILLQSIFDPHSPGHDGAVVVEDGRISRMCAHLPLSTNHAEIGHRGTRHSAGLGLSEICDAACIIVSEERGSVIFARNAKLANVASSTDLKRHLETFLAQDANSAATIGLGDRLFHAYGLKIACLLLAFLAWLIFASNTDIVERTFDVPVEFRNVPSHLRIAEPIPREVRVTLSGPQPAFDLLTPSTLKISLDLRGREAGNLQVDLAEQNIVRPDDLSVYGLEPQILHLRLEPAQSRGSHFRSDE